MVNEQARKLQITCKQCSNTFEQLYYLLDNVIECPNCHQKGKLTGSQDLGFEYEPVDTQYERSFYEFKQLLESEYADGLDSFFNDEMKLIFEKKQSQARLIDATGNQIDLLDVHVRVQNDAKLQRQFYNIWMTTFR